MFTTIQHGFLPGRLILSNFFAIIQNIVNERYLDFDKAFDFLGAPSC